MIRIDASYIQANYDGELRRRLLRPRRRLGQVVRKAQARFQPVRAPKVRASRRSNHSSC